MDVALMCVLPFSRSTLTLFTDTAESLSAEQVRWRCIATIWFKNGMVWYGMVPLLPPGPQSLRPGGGSWIGHQLSMLRLSPFRPRLFGDGFCFHRDRMV
jgi:hypothetical protein